VGGLMRASGVVLVPMVISVFCILGIQLPAAYLLDAYMGLPGVWVAFPIAYVAMLVLQSAYYHFVWRHRKIERLV
jgi:Na+-driven multidrug efflux pump